MRLKFWKRPKDFSFEKHRKPAVILHELIGAIITAISYVFSSSTIWGVAIGGTVYGVSGSALGSFLLMAVTMTVSSLTSSLSNKSGKQSPLSTGGLLLYRRRP